MRRLGLVLGAGGFAGVLRQQVADAGLEVAIYSVLPHHPEGKWIPLGEPEECVRIFAEDGVSAVLHAGDFGAPVFLGALVRNPSRLFAGVRLLVKATDVRGRLFEPYQHHLAMASISSLAARDLFEDYVPAFGQMGSVPVPQGWIDRGGNLLQAAADLLKHHQPTFGVAQTLVFDDDELVGVEKTGTDALLRGLPRPTSPDILRIMIKLLPEGLSATLDAPTIGPTTVERALRAGVRLIVLDAVHGQIIDRERAIAAADAGGISMFGSSSRA